MVPPGPRDPDQLGDGPVGVRDGLQHVTADHEVEGAGREVELEDRPVLEADPAAEVGRLRPGPFQMCVEDVHPEERRGREGLGEPPGGLAGPAAGVEDARRGRQGVPAQDGQLLRPDRLGLGGEVPHHRLVGHVLGVGVQVGRHSRRDKPSSVAPQSDPAPASDPRDPAPRPAGVHPRRRRLRPAPPERALLAALHRRPRRANARGRPPLPRRRPAEEPGPERIRPLVRRLRRDRQRRSGCAGSSGATRSRTWTWASPSSPRHGAGGTPGSRRRRSSPTPGTSWGCGAILAITDPDNAASIRVLERMGMRPDGSVRLPGETIDLLVFAWNA